ncbi:hypothetical protein DPEC_G00045840 [Dallia pectoralis]|uniref:Uncharacterized protein n=1 Tax=Dallia pectoralis TaxID=75939 RepID=A0ACC2H9T2_DALPE|nr:hypothetical protein DPEC_G00045840 [Dallia pectoralis]
MGIISIRASAFKGVAAMDESMEDYVNFTYDYFEYGDIEEPEVRINLHTVLRTGFPLATSLAFFNSCINPVLYMLVGKKFRQLLKRSCLDITRSSLHELSQSISGTESVSVEDINQDRIPPEEPIESSTV